MHRPARFPALFRLFVASVAILSFVLLAGCPQLRLAGVGIKDKSVGPEGLTLTATLVVDEADETPDDAELTTGRGLLSVHLPVGWSVTAARLKAPTETTERTLYPSPQTAVNFAEAFPKVNGQWWAFASHDHGVKQGSWTYEVELDVAYPKKTKGGEIGVSALLFTEDKTTFTSPKQYDVAIKGRSATLKARSGGLDMQPPPAAPAPSSDKASAG